MRLDAGMVGTGMYGWEQRSDSGSNADTGASARVLIDVGACTCVGWYNRAVSGGTLGNGDDCCGDGHSNWRWSDGFDKEA